MKDSNALILRNFGFVSMAAVLLLLAAGSIGDRAAAAEIVVSWTEVQQEVRPRPGFNRVSKSIRLSLRGGNVISDSFVATNGPKSSYRTNAGRLGNSIDFSSESKATWSVKDSKSLVRTQDRAQHASVITVTTQSDTSCSATISYALKPGFQEYRLVRVSGHVVYLRSLSAENVSCRTSP